MALVVLVVYGQLAGFDFVNYDDPYNVSENPHVRAGLTAASIRWAFTNDEVAQWIPLTWLSLMLDSELYGLNAGGYHATNVLLHVINTVLLFRVFRRMTGAVWRSAFVAALFALHPFHVQSVAWITERRDVLSSVFWFLTIWAYYRYTQQRTLRRHLVVTLLFVLGMMAKPMLVTFPFVLLLLDVWPLRRVALGRASPPAEQMEQHDLGSERRTVSLMKLMIEKIPWICIAIVFSALAFVFQSRLGNVLGTETIPVELRVANALVSYVRYIAKTIWPAGLTVFYPYPNTIPLAHVAGAGALLVAVSVFVMRAVRRHPYLAVGWFWYLGTLLPVIGLVQVGDQSMADHYSYIPIIGLFMMIAWGAPELWEKCRFPTAPLAGLACIAIVACTVATWRQIRHWQNSITLFEHALAVNPDNVVAHNNLGVALTERGEIEEAIAHFREALRVQPTYAAAHNNLGLVLARRGQLDQAVAHYREALRLNPAYIQARFNMASALAKLGRLDEALAEYIELLRVKPDHFQAHKNLADLLVRLGRTEEAIAHYVRAIELKPDSAEAHHNLGIVLAKLGEYAVASERFRAALRHKPGSAVTHYALAGVLARLGRAADAIAQYREALRLKPDWPEALRELAWILATHPEAQFRNGAEAARLAERACELSGYEPPAALDALAAAYAEAGRYDDAVSAAANALATAESAGQSELAGQIEQRLQLYRAGRPYRQIGTSR